MHFAKKCVCVIASVIVLLAIVYHSMNPIQSYNQVNFKDVGPYYSFGPENAGMYLMAQQHAGQGLNPNNMQFLETFTERQTPPVTTRPARTTVAKTTRPARTTVARTTVPIITRPARTTVPITTRPARTTVARTTVPIITRPARTTVPITTRPARTTVARTTVPITTRPARTTVPRTTRPARTKPQTTYAWSSDSYAYSPDHPPSTFSQDQPTYSYAHIVEEPTLIG